MADQPGVGFGSPSTQKATGSGTENAIPKWNAAGALADSRVVDSGAGPVAIAAPSVSIQDSDASHTVTLTPGNETANRVLSIPVMGGAAKVNISKTEQTADRIQIAESDGVMKNSAYTESNLKYVMAVMTALAG